MGTLTDGAKPSDQEVLLFQLGGRRFGLVSADVRELIRAVAIVALPKAPAVVEGLINLRGRLVPVLDVRARFRLPAKPLEPSDHFVVAWAGDRLVAIRVDEALDLIRLPGPQLEDVRRLVPGADYVAGVAMLPEGLVLIHDLRTFLSDLEAGALDAALSSVGSDAHP